MKIMLGNTICLFCTCLFLNKKLVSFSKYQTEDMTEDIYCSY